MIKLLILDIDGVLTDGKKTVDINGNCVSKIFFDQDWTGIKRFKAAGVKVVFLSGDKNINEQVAKNRNIPFYFSRGKDKGEMAKEIMKEYEVTPAETAGCGDDIFDLPFLKIVGHPYCPMNSCWDVKRYCAKTNSILRFKGGEGCVMDLYDELHIKNLVKETTLQDIMVLDHAEKI